MPKSIGIGIFSAKCFCALVVTVKRSVDETFMHYFHNLSSASEGRPLWGTFVPKPLICPPLEKILRAPMAINVTKLLSVEHTHMCMGDVDHAFKTAKSLCLTP